MNLPLRVLMVEDSDGDAVLILRTLRSGGYEVDYQVVETAAAMRAALERRDWDVITSDHLMPQFNAPAALALATELRPNLPFIIVSGEIDLNLAVSLMQKGARDYIQKRDLSRLIPAIERELREVELRRERQQAGDALEISEARYRRLFEATLDGIILLNADTAQIEDVNPCLINMLGYSHAELLGKKLWEVGPFEDITQCKETFAELQAKGYVRYEDLPLKTKAGATLEVEFVGNSYDCKGIKLIQCNIRNITERKRVEAALREQWKFFRLIVENIGDFIAVLDLDGRRLYNSPSYRRLFGSARELHGTDSFAEIHPQDQQRVKDVFRDTVQSGIGHQIEYSFLLENGDIRYMESRGEAIRDEQGRVACVVVVSRDITERKQMEDQVRQLAFYDPLTKLPNRRLFNDRLSQTMAASRRSGRYGALMFLDLDNFKLLNDTHGHEVGDLLLIEAAERLKSCVREMDTVARFGGDEFVVIISELDADKSGSTTRAGIISEKIRAVLADPYVLKVRHEGKAEATVEHRCTASIGVALFSKNGASQEDILRCADTIMYQAKAAGRNSIRFYDAKG